jgi:hypothetical protein
MVPIKAYKSFWELHIVSTDEEMMQSIQFNNIADKTLDEDGDAWKWLCYVMTYR